METINHITLAYSILAPLYYTTRRDDVGKIICRELCKSYSLIKGQYNCQNSSSLHRKENADSRIQFYFDPKRYLCRATEIVKKTEKIQKYIKQTQYQTH